ncbi:ankyrin [Hypoxylon argillaceum]|nr:ankyrin [Hypoxylon argillaceum]
MDSSLFASAAANLLSITIRIIGFLYGDWEYSSLALAERLIYELSELRNVLQSLEETALSVADMANLPPDNLLTCLEDMKTLLISLASKIVRQDARDSELLWLSFSVLTPSRGSSLQLSPAETASDIQKLQLYLSKLKSSIAKSVFCPIEKQLPKRITDLTGELWKDRAKYAECHESARDSRLDGTGRWFVINPKFRNWLTAQHVPNTLFCTGRPGSGKTILTSLAIDSVERWQKDMISPSVGFAYFYFNHKSPNPLRNVALALLEQLYLQSPSPSSDKDVTEHEALAAKAERIPFSDIVSAVIILSKQFQRVYIIIDALDECSPEHQDDLLYLLSSIKNSPVRLLTFSFSHQTFNIFNDSPHIKIIPSKQDILLYAQPSLQSLPVDCEYLRATIIANLLDIGKQHLMFQPIVLRLHDVLSKRTPKDITRELENVPRGIKAAYQDIFKRILTQDPHIVKIAQITFIWLCFSLRTLEIAEIIEVQRHNITEVEVDMLLIITSCMGLLVQSESKIHFTRSSVPDFIKEAIIGDEKDGVDSLIQSNSLLNYAAIYWGRHIRNVINKCSDELVTLKQSCLKLLKDKPRVAILCQILFSSRPHPKNRAISNGLVKSFWLHLAAYFGLDWAIDSLGDYMDSVTECDEWGRTPLHIAANNGFDDCVRRLLTKMSPNQQDVDGRTAWHYAAMSGNSQSISHLLEWQPGALHPNRVIPATSLGADEMGKGKSPLEYAVINGNTEMFQTLLPLSTSESHGTIKDEPFLANAMVLAAERGKMEIVEYILSRNPTPHYEHLLAAAKGGFEDIVSLLVEYGVEVTNPVEDGDSAIVVAARATQNKVLQLLIWNTLLERPIKEIDNALLSAVKVGNTKGVMILLRAGANPNASIDGKDELIVYAARNDMADIVGILSSFGAKPSQTASVAVATGNSKV